jgi:TonB-dependent heme/hemoglobin receptor
MPRTCSTAEIAALTGRTQSTTANPGIFEGLVLRPRRDVVLQRRFVRLSIKERKQIMQVHTLFHRRLLPVLLLAGLSAAGFANAQESAPAHDNGSTPIDPVLKNSGAGGEAVLPEISVVDTSEQETSTAAPRVTQEQGAVTVTNERIQDQQATTLEEALRKLTNVQIDSVNGAQGSEISIRGQSSDAVSVRVEGAPKNRSQIMHKNDNDRDTVWLDMDMYQDITVIPGAAASVYGTGSTGGVLLLSTKDPENVIKPGRDWGANLRYGHETNGVGNHLSTDLAKRFNAVFAANLTLTTADVQAYRDGDGNYPAYGGTGAKTFSYLLKGVLTPVRDHRIELSVLDTRMKYSRYAEDSAIPAQVNETKWKTMDRTASLEYAWRPTGSNLIDLKLRASRSWTESANRDMISATAYRDRGTIQTDYWELENTSLLQQSNAIVHRLRYGADYTDDDIVQSYTDVITGGNLKAHRKQVGAYFLDSIALGETLNLTPSVRYNTYSMGRYNANVDGESSISPTVSAAWRPLEGTPLKGLAFTALWGKGYKAPSINQMYGRGGVAPYFGSDDDGDGVYTGTCTAGTSRDSCGTLPNENLTGESSKSYEVGLMYQRNGLLRPNDEARARINYVHTRIKDRITAVTLGVGANGGIVDQMQNVEDAEVKGWELSMNYDGDLLFMDFSAQIMKGYDLSGGTRTRLTDVKPRNIAAGVGVYFAGRQGRIGLDMQNRASLKTTSSNGRGGATTTVYPSYTVYDLYADYHVDKNLRLQFRIANLADKLYTKRSYAVGTASDDITYYPGRNFKLNLTYQF